MDHVIDKKTEELQSKEALIDAENALHEEVHKFNLEFAELSPVIRELLSRIYIRGGLDTLKKLKRVKA